jgi:hypothetical protein
LLCQFDTEFMRLRATATNFGTQDFAAVGLTYKPTQIYLVTFKLSITGNGHLATTIQRLIEGALGANAQRRFGVGQRCDQFSYLGIIAANLDSKNALAN